MFDSIADSLQAIFRKLGIRGKLTEKNIQEGLREVRVALLQADVNYRVVKDFIDRVTIRAIGQEVIRSVQPAQQIVKIVNDELVSLMGPVDHKIPTNPKGPAVVMLVGLQGSGKTTTCAKLAQYARGKGFAPMLVAADVQRPAAIKQLQVLGQQLGLPVYAEERASRPVKICERSLSFAEQNNRNLVIFDTAGRLHINKELMDELKEIIEKTNPQQIYLVSDAMTGQDAVNSAKEFNDQLALDGIILTKLDGDARGGAALSIKAVTGKPIKYVGIGEKIDQFEEFHPERMASRILGMGDIISLVEKAQQTIDVEQAKKIEEKLRKNELNLQDFLDQFQQMKKMGPLKDLIGMIPGMGRMVKDVDENEFKRVEAIIQSMTKDERAHPEILDGSRRNRVARGSGTSVAEVNSLLRQFRDMRKMMKGAGKFQKLFGGKIPGGLGQLGQT